MVAPRLEIGAAQKKFAHPTLENRARFAGAKFRKMSFVEENCERQRSELSNNPSRRETGGDTPGENLDQSIDAQSPGKKECRVVRQHRQIEAHGKSQHPADRFFR